MRAVRQDAKHRNRLAGLLHCTPCGWACESHWVHHRAGYRCRCARSTDTQEVIDHLRTQGVRLSCHPQTRTLETSSQPLVRITV